MSDQTTITCGGCGGEVRSGSPTSSVFDDRAYLVDCVPPTHASQA